MPQNDRPVTPEFFRSAFGPEIDELRSKVEAMPDTATDAERHQVSHQLLRTITPFDSPLGNKWNKGQPLDSFAHLKIAQEISRSGTTDVLLTPEFKELMPIVKDEEAVFKLAESRKDAWTKFSDYMADQKEPGLPLADDMLVDAPEEVKKANDIRRTIRRAKERLVDFRAQEYQVPDAIDELTYTDDEAATAAKTVDDWRQKYNKKRVVSGYIAEVMANNNIRAYEMNRQNLSPTGDKIVLEAMETGRISPENIDAFEKLDFPDQQLVAVLAGNAKTPGNKAVLRDAVTEMIHAAWATPADAIDHYIIRTVARAWMSDEEYQKRAQTNALKAELLADRPYQDYGYWSRALIGAGANIPYTLWAGVPYVGMPIVAGAQAKQQENRVAAEGGDVTGWDFILKNNLTAAAVAGLERLQFRSLGRPLTALEQRAAFARFLQPANYKTIKGLQMLGRSTVEFGKERLNVTGKETVTESLQQWLEAGFVANGLGRDEASEAARETIQALPDTIGTMFLTSIGGGAKQVVHSRYSRNLTLDQMAAGLLHANALVKAYQAKDEEGVRRHREALGGAARIWRDAGSHENAVARFVEEGLDDNSARILSGFLQAEYESIMGNPDLTATEKELLVGKTITSAQAYQQVFPGSRIDNMQPDGSYTLKQNINGVPTITLVAVTPDLKLDPTSPNAVSSIVQTLNGMKNDDGTMIEPAPKAKEGEQDDGLWTPAKWLALTPEQQQAIIMTHELSPAGQFTFTARREEAGPAGPEGATITEPQLRALEGQIDLATTATPGTIFHEDFHKFIRFLRELGSITPQDIQRLKDEFGEARPGVNELFNEEEAADRFRDMAAGKVHFVQRTGLEKVWDALTGLVDRLTAARRQAEKIETIRQSIFAQMLRGEYTGIPTGTISEEQRQKNASTRAEAARKAAEEAKKAKEAAARKAQQAQDAAKAQAQAETPPAGTPPANANVAPSDEAAAAAAEAEAAKGKQTEAATPAPIGKGEWRAVTPQGNVYVRGEWMVVDLNDLITSDQAGYDQTIQPRDRGTVKSREQIHEIARILNPAQLLDSAKTDDGAPVVLPNRSVLSGNGRVMALREAATIGTIGPYLATVRQKAAELGIAIPDGISTPVLVRRLDQIEGPTTLQRVAELSNRPAILLRSEAETAEADAKTILDKDLLRLFQPGADGNLLASSNREFIAALVRATGDASLVDSNGDPTDATEKRIRRALIALMVGFGEDSRPIVRGLVEDAKELGMKTELAGVMRASADIVTIARDRPQYSLLDDIASTLRAYMDMKRDNLSPDQGDLFGRPPAIDMLLKALWGRSTAADIAALFSEYAARARQIDTSTAGLGLDKDPTKEELLAQAIAATATKETAEQAQKKKAAAAQAEEPPAPPPTPTPTPADKAKDKKSPISTANDLQQAIDAGETPEPAKYDPTPNAPAQDGDGQQTMFDEMRYWRETPTMPASANPAYIGANGKVNPDNASEILPYSLAGNKAHIYAHHADFFATLARNATAVWDLFGGAATYIYNLAEMGALPAGSRWNEWEYTRYVTTNQIKSNPSGVIRAMDSLSERLQRDIPPGDRTGDDINMVRQQILDWLNAELRGEHGVSYVLREDDGQGRVELANTPEMAALYLLVQNISYSARSQDVSMVGGNPTWTTAGSDEKAHPTDAKVLTLVDSAGKWSIPRRLADYKTMITQASARLQNVEVTQGDGWEAVKDAPAGALVFIDSSYFGAMNYGLKTREDGDVAKWLEKAKERLATRKDLTYVITNNWNFHAVSELEKSGFLVARTERANDKPELVALDGLARRLVAPPIRSVDHIGQRLADASVQPGGTADASDGSAQQTSGGPAAEGGGTRPDGQAGPQTGAVGDQPRLSVTAKARKALESGVYKDQAKQTIADLNRLPATLRPYVAKYSDPDDLISLSQYAGWKTGPKVAPAHLQTYRPAVRLKSGEIAWHPRARMHAEALSMWLKQEGRDIATFDIDQYYGDGGIGPDGRYYEKAYIGDGPSDFEQTRMSVQATAPAFYSQLRRVIEQKVPNRATVAQVRATIDPAKGNGVKADEIFWSGLQEFLDSKKPEDMVTKEEVLAATREVVVTDVVKGGNEFDGWTQQQIIDNLIENEIATPDEVRGLTRDELIKLGEERASQFDKDDSGISTTKFAQWQLPGGENYRELLLTLPSDEYHVALERFARANGIDDIMDAEQAFQKATGRRPNDSNPDFRSGHFSEPNVVAHVRFNERTSADGKRTLFIEEIQSDWAQKGKKEGFNDSTGSWAVEDTSPPLFGERTQETPRVWEVFTKSGDSLGMYQSETEKDAIKQAFKGRGQPPAPYVTKTDAWVSLALKRMVRWAAENGFDQIAWTTGEQQAERYDLSKQIDHIYWMPDTGELKAFKKGVTEAVITENGVTAEKLEDYIGKDAAQKLIDAPAIEDEVAGGKVKKLKNADLKVGGEGMKGFYDQIVPTTANKLFKRFGTNVGETTIGDGTGEWYVYDGNTRLAGPFDTKAEATEANDSLYGGNNEVNTTIDNKGGEGPQTVHALPITTAMRESVMTEGQARFSFTYRRPTTPQASATSKAVAALSIQHILGVELGNEQARKAIHLYGLPDGTKPAELIAAAQDMAKTRIGQAAAEALKNRQGDPEKARKAMESLAELEATQAARAGVETGLKMGMAGQKAQDAATKRLIREAEAAEPREFVVQTGIDPTKVMLAVLPELFKRMNAQQEGPQQPEGPKQAPLEASPQAPLQATPEQLAERDRRKRNIVEQVRAWFDAERARKEKEAADRAKAKAEAEAEGAGGETEAKDQAPADQDEPDIPPELLTGEGADLRNADEFARALRLWIADWIVKRSNGRLTHQTVWKDAEAIATYRKTMTGLLEDMAWGMLDREGVALPEAVRMIGDIADNARPDTIEARTASIIASIQGNAIRQTRNKLIEEIRDRIDKNAAPKGEVDPNEDDMRRKIPGEMQKTAKYIKSFLSWSEERVEAEIDRLKTSLDDRERLYDDLAESGIQRSVDLDIQYHYDQIKLAVLERWGGLKHKLPSEIIEGGREIDEWMAKAHVRLMGRINDMVEDYRNQAQTLRKNFTPSNPTQAQNEPGLLDRLEDFMSATIRQKLEAFLRVQRDENGRKDALKVIERIEYLLSAGGQEYSVLHRQFMDEWQAAMLEINGSAKAAEQHRRHLEDAIPTEHAIYLSRQGLNGIADFTRAILKMKPRIMTYGQAIQLYGELRQVSSFSGNIEKHGRTDHERYIADNVLTAQDLKLSRRLLDIYEEHRKLLSPVIHSVSGMLVWRPDPYYLPAKMLMGASGGIGQTGQIRRYKPIRDVFSRRVRNLRDFDESASIQDMYYQRAEDTARAIAFGVRGLTIRGVLGNKELQDTIVRYHGKAALHALMKQVTEQMEGLEQPKNDPISSLARILRQANTYAMLSWSPKAIKQALGMPVWSMILDGGYRELFGLAKGFDMETAKKLYAHRGRMARYGHGIMPEIAEAFENRRNGMIIRFYKAGLSVHQIGDLISSLYIATGYYKSKRNELKENGYSDEEADDMALTLAWNAVEMTQQTSQPMNMPTPYRFTGPLAEIGKAMIAFGSSPALQNSHEYHAMMDWRAGVPGAGKRWIRAIITNHIIMTGLMTLVDSMFAWMVGDEPEDDKELLMRVFGRVMYNFFVGPFSRVMLAGPLLESLYRAGTTGNTPMSSGMIPAESTIRTAAYLAAMPRDIYEWDVDEIKKDVIHIIAGLSAPTRMAVKFYDNRIAGE